MVGGPGRETQEESERKKLGVREEERREEKPNTRTTSPDVEVVKVESSSKGWLVR